MSFDNLPCGWKLVTLEDAMDAIIDYRGKTPKKTESGIPLITAKIVKGGYVLEPFEFIAEDNYDSWMVRGLPQVGDVVLTTEAPLGETAQLTSSNVALAQRIVTLRGKKGLLDNDFLLCALQSDFVQHQLESRASGSTVKGIKQSELRKVSLPIPPLHQQKKISKVLKSLSNKLVCNTQTNQTLEQIAQAIFKSWFVDFDPVKAKMNGEQPEGMDAETASLFPEKLVESELGLIPDGWEVEPLKNVSRVINGRAYKNTEFKEEGTPIIRIQNLTGKGKTVYSDLDLPEDKLVEHGDLIFAWSATFGPHLWRGPKSIYHYHIWKMDVNEKRFGKYLLFMHLARLTDYLKNQGTGSIFTHLTKAIMESQKLVVPSEPIVEAFSKVVTPLFAQIDSLHKENQVLEQLRDTLLPKLLSGEIELGKE